ncbi:MAG: XdhC family protein [Phycisphaerae bacterium]|jgi:xanthine dehydrogenase accessory factor|nr:XdhC family protein [Phycisphaerae bacterium]
MNIHARAAELAGGGAEFALALILATEGSTPRKAGVKAIVDSQGAIFGTLGGGYVEIEVQRLAPDVCASGRPVVLDFNLDDVHACNGGPICGGTVRVLLDPTAAKDSAAYAQAAEALKLRKRGVLVTVFRDRDDPEVSVQWFGSEAIGDCTEFPGADVLEARLAGETPKLFSQTGEEAFVEPVIPRPRLLIAGGGHIGRALAPLTVGLGFDVTVLDDRPEFSDPNLFGESVATRCGVVPDEIARIGLDEDTYVVIVTPSHKHDAEALQACVKSNAAYVGMIGSRRKVALIRESFIESGLADEAELDRMFAPIGLDIGAVTVEEIATSIAAQLVAVRRKGSAVMR